MAGSIEAHLRLLRGSTSQGNEMGHNCLNSWLWVSCTFAGHNKMIRGALVAEYGELGA